MSDSGIDSTGTGATDLERRTLRRLTVRLVPLLMALYFVNYLDRTNLGIAKAEVSADLQLSATMFGLASGIPVVVGLLARFHGLLTGGQQQVDAAGDVADLALGVEDQAAAAGQIGAGAVHAEEVREARDGDAEVGGRPLPPRVMQFDSVATGNGQ